MRGAADSDANPADMTADPTFYEFFAGGGMVRAGLGPQWRCLFANDFDARKAAAYRLNFPAPDVLRVDDIRRVSAAELPGEADLMWGSFPCQDLSLAGVGAGLQGKRSSAFYPFCSIVQGLAEAARGPRIIALENVVGTLTSHGGADFSAICEAIAACGYRFGALVINAAEFVPQSRPRLFMIAVRQDLPVDRSLLTPGPAGPFHPPGLQRALGRVTSAAASRTVWWNLPAPPRRNIAFADLVEDEPSSVSWHSPGQQERLLSMMSPLNRAKINTARQAGRRVVGAVYRRTRPDGAGGRRQRAEVRFDDVAGCLRTPAGGSSRQIIMVVDGERMRTRLISARETARLMGLEDSYHLPANYNEAYQLTGDGVAAPVVRHLAESLFEPLLGLSPQRQAA